MQPVKKALNLVFFTSLALVSASVFQAIVKTVAGQRPPFALVAGGLVFAIVGLAASFILKPLKYKTRPPSPKTHFESVRRQADVVVLVSLEKVAEAAKAPSFAEKDWSLEWGNIVDAAVGPHSIVDVETLRDDEVEKAALVVVTRSASAAMDERLAGRLASFVEQGGLLIAEGPSCLLDKAVGLRGLAARPLKTTMDYISPALVADDSARSWLKRRPIISRFYLTKQRQHRAGGDSTPGLEVLASTSGHNAICHIPLGRGHLVAILFDLSTWFVGLKQGIFPHGRWRSLVDLRNGLRWPKPADFIPSVRQFGGKEPIPPLAELLSDGLFAFAASKRPFPRASRLPPGKDAYLVLTHDEDYDPVALAQVLEEEKAAGVPQTVFLLADCPRPEAAQRSILSKASEIGLHWNRFRLHFDRKGCHINSFGEPTEAIAQLSRELELKSLVSSRIHWLVWDRRPGQTQQHLAQAGIMLDSSQGPVASAKGYLFATGWPFAPLDQNCQPINILEVPYQIEDDLCSADASFIEALVEGNLKTWHSGLVVLLHPWVARATGRLSQTFLSILQLAKKERLWTTTLDALFRFHQARLGTKLTSTFEQERLVLEVESPKPGLRILLPAWHNGRKIRAVQVDGTGETPIEPEATVPIDLDPGPHLVSATYSKL